MFHKDTLRLIKKTFKRFLTIFLMVLIGVSFMVGLLSTKPIMHKSVDRYYDETNFMDVQLYSSYGFNDEDVKALKENEIIGDVYSSKFIDVYAKNNDNRFVTRVQEIESDVNQYELISGRMPENESEALVLGSSSFGTVFEEGSTVTLYLEDKEISDSLTHQEYEIVGTVRAPQYMASSKETSTLNNLTLQAVVYVNQNNFKNDYYTSLFLTFSNTKEVISFSKEYKTILKEDIKELEKIASKQENNRKEEIKQQLEEEIKKGEKELEEKINLAQDEIDAGYQQLEKAYQDIQKAEQQIQENEQKLQDGEKEIEDNRLLLEKNKKEIESAKEFIEKEMNMSFDEAVTQMNQLYEFYTILEKVKEESNGDQKINEIIIQNTTEISELTLKNELLELEILKLEAQGNNTLKIIELKAQIQRNESKIDRIQAENKILFRILNIYKNSPIDKVLSLLDRMANGSVKETYAQLIQLQEGESKLQDGFAQIKAAQAEIESGKAQLMDAKHQLENGKSTYLDGLNELNAAQNTLNKENEKARIELDKAKQQLEELPDAGWIILDREKHYSTMMFENNANQMGKIGEVFPLLFFLVAALVCMTTMKRLVDEERSQIGVFSALGFSKNQIISKYVIYAFLASILASVIGVVVGIPIFPNVIYFCWKLMYDLPDVYLYLPFHTACIGALSFTTLMVLVTYFVARSALKEMPSQLLRPKAPKQAKKVFLEHIHFIWNSLSFTSKVTARNLIRYKSRFFMTIIGVAGCTSLLVLGFGIKDSISQIIDIQYGEIMQYTYTVTLEDDSYFDTFLNRLQKDENVEKVVPYMSYSSKVYVEDEPTLSVYVVNENQYQDIFNLRTRKNHRPLTLEKGVVISEKFAKANQIQVGDTIKIKSKNGIKKEVEVEGICEMYFQHYLFISEENYTSLFNETLLYEQFAIQPIENSKFMNEIEHEKGVESISDFEEMKDMFKTMIEALDIIVVVILIASGSLAFVVLVNLTEVNISERIREIATLKVLGFYNQEVNRYIFNEIFLLTILGAILGLPLGKLELGYVMSIIDMEMVMFGNQIEWLSYFYGFMITLSFALIVALFMRSSLRKVEMVESLKSVE